MNNHDHLVSAKALEKIADILEKSGPPIPEMKASIHHHQTYINILRASAHGHRCAVESKGEDLCLVH